MLIILIAVIKTIITIVIHREIHNHQEEKMIMKSQVIQIKTFLRMIKMDEVARGNILQITLPNI